MIKFVFTQKGNRMKKILLFAIFASGVTITAAQVKLTQETHGFFADLKNPMVLTSYVEPGQSGSNVYGTSASCRFRILLPVILKVFTLQSVAASLPRVMWYLRSSETSLFLNQPLQALSRLVTCRQMG